MLDDGAEDEAPSSAPEPRGHLGRYWLRGILGRGGMSTVMDAFDPSLDRRVDLKLLHAWGGWTRRRSTTAVPR